MEFSCVATLTPQAQGQTIPGTVRVTVTGTRYNTSLWDNFSATYHFVAGTPTFSQPAGNLAQGATIEINTVTPGAEIHYTLDGNKPTAGSPIYSSPIFREGTFTLKAMAISPGYKDSEVASAIYTGAGFVGSCTEWNAIIADRMVTCFLADPAYLAGLPGAIDCATIQDDIDAGSTTFDVTQAPACTEALEALACDDLVPVEPVPFVFPMPETACAAAVVGIGTEVCSRNTQCASTYCSATTTRTCPGGCQQRIADGDSCTFAGECAYGLTCREGKCMVALAGADCFMHLDCAPSMRCIEGTCKSAGALNSQCPDSATCAAGTVCFDIMCQPIVGLDGACTPAMAPNMPTVCAAGFWCDVDKCALLPKVGEPCASTMACTGGYCDLSGAEPTCAAYMNTGDTCTSKFECASQLASGDKCVAPGEFFCTQP